MEKANPSQVTRAAEIVVPLSGRATEPARLSFDNGLAHVDLQPGADSGVLLAARFGEPLPITWTAGEHRVHVEYPLGALLRRRMGPNLVRLNAAVPWALDVHGGAADLSAELASVELHSVAFHSGTADLRFALGFPTGIRTLRFASVKNLVVDRPAGVPVRLEVSKGAVNVALDHRSFRAVTGLTDQTDGYHPDGSGYRIVVSGGADTITVNEVS